MSYKVFYNATYKSDCDFCIFNGKCKSDCPLKVGYYFGSSRSKKADFREIWREK